MWTLVPAHLDGKEQNWLLIRRRDDEPHGAVPRRGYRADARDARRAAAARRRLALRGEVRRLPRARLRPRRRVPPRSRNDNDLTERFADGREGGRERGQDAGRRPRRRGLRARRAGPPELLASCSRERARSSTTPSTCSSSTASRSSTCRSRSGRSSCAELLDGREPTVSLLRELRRRRRAARGGRGEQGLEGVVAKRLDSRYRPGRRTRDWLKVKTQADQEFVDRRLHARRGPARRHVRRAGPRRSTRAASCAGSATSAPASTTRRSTACSSAAAAARARRRRRSPSAPKMPRVRKGDVHVGRAAARRARSSSASGRTTAASASRPTSGLREDKAPREVRARAAAARR